MGHTQEILWCFIILGCIKRYFESKRTQAMRKMMKTKNLQIVAKNQQWIHVNVPVMSLQRFSDFKILPEQKMTKFDIPSFGKKSQIWCFLHFLKNISLNFSVNQKLKTRLLLKFGHKPHD